MNDIPSALGYIVGVGSVVISAVVAITAKTKYETNAKLDSETIAAQERLLTVTKTERDSADKSRMDFEKQAAVFKAESNAKEITITELKEYNSRQADFSKLIKVSNDNHKEVILKLAEMNERLIDRRLKKP